jgi:hypothetical protein
MQTAEKGLKGGVRKQVPCGAEMFSRTVKNDCRHSHDGLVGMARRVGSEG